MAYTWRSKLTTLAMEAFRRMRNSSRQITAEARSNIVKGFITKLMSSGYTETTTNGIIKSGMSYYYQKLRADLAGGPPLNARLESEVMKKRRQKLGAGEKWFSRRRGGQKERDLKDSGWRLERAPGGEGLNGRQGWRTQGGAGGEGARRCQECRSRTNRGGKVKRPEQSETETNKVVAILLVPYTVNSVLKDKIQEAEDNFQRVIKGDRVRIVESGGDILSNVLGRMDPWVDGRVCTDIRCWTCESRTWDKEQQKASRSEGKALPKGLVLPKSGLCRREGVTYSLQCATCLLQGCKALYQGESGVSA